MTEKNQPNLAKDLRLVHKIITRGLDVSIESAETFAQEGFPDQDVREGYRKYATALLSFVSSHHSGEDEIAFPYFRERLPAMPFDRLEWEHERIEELLERGQGYLDHLEDEQALRDLTSVLQEIDKIWQSHITVEEEHFNIEDMAEMLPPKEHERLSGKMAQHSIEHAEPTYLVVPFGLYNLPADQREILASKMPPKVINELVPKVWKEKWAPMQPFLLE